MAMTSSSWKPLGTANCKLGGVTGRRGLELCTIRCFLKSQDRITAGFDGELIFLKRQGLFLKRVVSQKLKNLGRSNFFWSPLFRGTSVAENVVTRANEQKLHSQWLPIAKRRGLIFLIGSAFIALLIVSGPTTCALAPYALQPTYALTEENLLFLEAWRTVDRAYVDKSFNGQSWFRYREDVLRREPMKTREETYAAIRKMLATLDDPFTRFLEPDKFKALKSGTSGALTGVGLEVGFDVSTGGTSEDLVVVSPVSGGPAGRAGILPGDVILAKTMETFLQAQSHIFYTKPAEPLAGEDVTVYYNPSNTVLNGKPDVYMRGSFNRWTHFLGCFEPIKMVKAENGTHLEATVKIPKDAYVMDFVFSERGDDRGGIYDNRNGLDYHVPVKGGLLSQPPLDIIHIAVEMAPIAKVGGLGDVVTSLARAVQESGHNTEIILPKYDCLNYKYIQDLQEVQAFHFGGSKVRVWNGKVEGLTVHFLEPENGMFWAGCIYGRRDDGARFGFFCHSALEFLRQSGKHVDIIHCHDWSSAPVAWLFNEGYRLNNMHDSRIVFSIHNLEFGAPLIGRAMANAHMATTVSPTYAAEVAGNGVIAPHLHKFHGIRNGIDPEIWDPYTDPFIPVAYTTESVTEGKRAAKEELRRRLGLRQDDRPMLGIITRLTAQKGIALIKHGIYRTLERGGQVVLLGSAPDPRVQNEFVNLSNQLNQSHGDMARLCLSYDEPLSHLIYAGSDFILIPSIFEPCGLTQLTAMRYGAIPVVRKTGGLNDTVFDVDHDKERARAQGLAVNGFSFEAPDAAGLDYALNRAISAWYEARDWFQDLCKQVMQQDWTWNRPALDYIELYYGAKKKP